ncbi:helix-turn-helix domain-containing protein [Nonomuraea candida]|uniref:helix-turn-helix domain-containing protein n=1 Tax=Nonomuraea candida TaxID=359159 RepID=UPI0005BCA743|nr:helix-turn-helix domain-containing protein [Nonomuraea candida]
MSNLSEDWAMYYAPVISPTEKLVLVAMAQRTPDDGTNSYKSKKTLAQAAMCDTKTVQKVQAALRERGLIASGDQSVAKHIPANRRPHVYDLQIPYSWFSDAQMAQVNAERATRGLPPLQPADRPDLAPAPKRAARSDKGKAAPQRRPKSLGPRPDNDTPPDQGEHDPDAWGVSQTPQGGEARGVSETPPGGFSKDARRVSESPNSFRENSLTRNSLQDPPPAVGGLQVGEEPGRADLRSGADKPATTKGTNQRPPVAPAAAVFEQLPQELRRRISRGASGKVLAAIQRELGSRSPAELVERIERRWLWWQHKGERVNDAVPVAVTIVQARRCANVRCEDGQDLDHGGDCPACEGGKRRTDRPAQPEQPAPAAPAAPAAVPPAARPTPTPPAWKERRAELDEKAAAAPTDTEPRPRPQKASTGRGEIAKAAIEAARASLRPRRLSDRERELQAARDRVYCEKCGADHGSWCVNGDGIEAIGFIHPARVLALRAAQQADQPAHGEGQVA